jgi:hypothetical protein
MKRLLVAALLLLGLTTVSEARMRHSVAGGCVEAGTVMQPTCMGAAIRAVPRHTKIVFHAKHRVPVQKIRVVSSRHAESGMVKASSGAVAHVAAHVAGAFQCVINKLESEGYPVKFMGGWASHGHIRHSLHYAGLALDINQIGRNVTRPRMPANEVSLANSCGLTSGAQWRHADSGHFQIATSRESSPDRVLRRVAEGVEASVSAFHCRSSHRAPRSGCRGPRHRLGCASCRSERHQV